MRVIKLIHAKSAPTPTTEPMAEQAEQRAVLMRQSKDELADEVLRLRKQIDQREKQWQQDKYAAVCLENMYQFVGLCDAEGRLVEANKPALTAGGLTFEEVFGQYLW
jgi:PAS domain-containing protein